MFRTTVEPPPFSGAVVAPYPGEHVDSIIRRFKKITQKSLILVDARRHEYFTPKSERRRIKSRKARTRRHDA